MFFRLSSVELWLIIFGVIAAATASGVFLGRYLRHRSETLREPFGVLQGALLGVVGLVLAFGLSLAVGRYEARRAAVVSEANAIGTTYLRAQLLSEPVRTRSLGLLATTPISRLQSRTKCRAATRCGAPLADGQDLVQRHLWRLAGQAVDDAPVGSAPRLYIETLNEMIDQQTVRVAGAHNRVPAPSCARGDRSRARAGSSRSTSLSSAAAWCRCWRPRRSSRGSCSSPSISTGRRGAHHVPRRRSSRSAPRWRSRRRPVKSLAAPRGRPMLTVPSRPRV